MSAKNPVYIQLDTRKVRRFLDDIHNNAVEKAIAPALNRAIKKVNTQVVRRIAKRSGMLQKDVKSLLPLQLAPRGGKTAAITTKRNYRTPNLIRFKAKETSKHLSAKAFGRTLKYPKGFIGNQGRTAFKRTGKTAHPIEALYGSNPVRAFGSDQHLPVFVRYARVVLPIEYNRALAFYLSRIRTR